LNYLVDIDYENYCLSILCSMYASGEMPKGEILKLYLGW